MGHFPEHSHLGTDQSLQLTLMHVYGPWEENCNVTFVFFFREETHKLIFITLLLFCIKVEWCSVYHTCSVSPGFHGGVQVFAVHVGLTLTPSGHLVTLHHLLFGRSIDKKHCCDASVIAESWS